MIHLSPRFFVLPLVAVAVIAGLSHGAGTSAGPRSAVVEPTSCAPSTTAVCVAAAPSPSMVR
ncbi:MAG TPA: hypothetical protein VNR11_17370 [Xanthobacteraceae bacterium]|nr:hypothetical protein [Xanthobacteraceae bacterium]